MRGVIGWGCTRSVGWVYDGSVGKVYEGSVEFFSSAAVSYYPHLDTPRISSGTSRITSGTCKIIGFHVIFNRINYWHELMK